MTEAEAENIAIKALGWMAQDTEIIGGFLGVTGASPDEIRDRAGDPEFLGFVLDYLLSDDAMVMAFCDATHTPAAAPMEARASLPGGQIPNWT